MGVCLRWGVELTGFVEVVLYTCLEGCGLGAKYENRGQRPQLQWCGGFAPASWFRIWIYCSRGSLTPVAAPNDFLGGEWM